MKETIEFTGERMAPGKTLRTFFLEHLERYYFALKFVKGKKILDMGCGEGYGPHLLSQRAKTVWAIDIDKTTVDKARQKYYRHNLKFSCVSAVKTGFQDNTFDVITAFEIFEHLKNPEELLSEAKRILKPKGSLIVSTPNKALQSPGSNKPRSPYHTREFYLEEFQEILKKYFPKIEIFAQPPRNLLSKMYILISRRVDLQKMGPWLLNLQKILVKFKRPKIQPGEKLLLPKFKKNNFSSALCFVAVCQK